MKSIQFEIFFIFYISLGIEVLGKIHYHTYRIPQSRSTAYVPKVIDKTCLLNPNVGPCRGEIPMYYYNPRERNCSLFYWGGCQGNGNRFDTKTECLEKCWSKPNEIKVRPKFCKLSFDYGFCFGDIKRWYYDHVWKTCKETIYSGCGGNKNNFYGLEQCESVCRFGNGRLTFAPAAKYGGGKFLIINSQNATTKRGKLQTTTTTMKSHT